MQAGTPLGPYEIVGPLGAGGMGEVYRARDTRLGREVAVKVLPVALARDPDRLRRFEREARTVASLSHSNILALYDVGSHEGRHYLVTELLEGQSLEQRLRGGAVTIARAVEIAVQIAKGVAAAHEKGIVHRDLKPANVFITTDGTAKILDFGLAKLTQPEIKGALATTSTATGVVLGSAAYMSPEQARGLPVDHRSDLFSLGAVLYEMLSGERPFRGENASEVTAAILRDDPPPLPATVPAALERIVRRCLEKRPDDRFTSARDLGFALQAVADSAPREIARRPEEPRPYPGLAAFTEADAERFFGREEEIVALWRTLPERKLLALIGPSGAGKTSFLRAGSVPHAPPGWRCLVATPGQAPFAGLARALVPAFAGDAGSVERLLDFHEPEVALPLIAQWRSRADRGLIIVDQFEELFTLNGEEVQARFADLLGKISELDGVHVLLSMRDDFLFACHAHRALAPIFSSITPLGPPTGGALRRAVVEPASRLGCAFEDDALPDEMVQAVAGERGALPLLAFAVARLWEERNREGKRLTREAYERLGGVAGALAQHAEATLERIGGEREPLVRELLRNLVTARQTRCVADAEELLSVFPADRRAAAGEVLNQLVDARLLTRFEVEGPDGGRRRRVEVVHESLLQRWPRLVRWQAQDADGALLRDQLRQAAHLWQEKGKPDDLLWTGSAVTEYELWRERYPGGLSDLEEAFGNAMTGHARRQRRRRRTAYGAVLCATVAVAMGLGLMWRRSALETRRAEAEARHREAAQLLALGRLRLADRPSAALAYAIASLGCADNEPARRFAVEVVWQGPPALFTPEMVPPYSREWSPDGRWLALGGETGLFLLSRDTGERRRLMMSQEIGLGFTSDGRRLVSIDWSSGGRNLVHFWSLPDARLERTLENVGAWQVFLRNDRLLAFTFDESAPAGEQAATVRRLSLDGTTREELGRWEPHGLSDWALDPTGATIVSLQHGRLLEQRLDALSSPPRVLGARQGATGMWMRPWRDRVVTSDDAGSLHIWDVHSTRLERTLKSAAGGRIWDVGLDPKGRFVATGGRQSAPIAMGLFDLAAPRAAEPTKLPGAGFGAWELLFSPDGMWLTSVHGSGLVLWNLATPRSLVVGRQKPLLVNAAFTPDGDLLSASDEGVVRRWALSPSASDPVRVVWSRPGFALGQVLLLGAGGCSAVLTGVYGDVFVVPLDGSPASKHRLKRPAGIFLISANAKLDASGKFLATMVHATQGPEHNGIRILDLSTGEERSLDTHAKDADRCAEAGSAQDGMAVPLWLPDGRLVTSGDGGLRMWDLTTGANRLVRPCTKAEADGTLHELVGTPDSRFLLRLVPVDTPGVTSSLQVLDLQSGGAREIVSHGNGLSALVLDASGAILVTGDRDGVVRVGPVTGEEPHLLFGHTAAVMSVAVSPDGRSIASGSEDGTIRLWPMPDLSKPPAHTLPHDELVAKLRSLTNLRAVRDPAASSGWRIDIGPFPGWANVPDWQP